MANFTPPFSNSADRRFPTSDERQQGFDCGPADQTLFNGMFHRIEAEIGEVIRHAGITGTDADLTQLRQAIVAIVNAATGGNPAGYILMNQARARLPIFPEVQTTDGRINIVPVGGNSVRVPGGVTILHRGIFPVTSAQTDFVTVANKTYHLRWNPIDGFVLRDLSASSYNPNGLPETDRSFDSGFDDMLIARVITNASNIPTITNLANSNNLAFATNTGRLTDGITYNSQGMQYGTNCAVRANNAFAYNFSRTPLLTSINAILGAGNPGPQIGKGIHGVANVIFNKLTTRYLTRFDLATDWEPEAGNFYAEIDFATLV